MALNLQALVKSSFYFFDQAYVDPLLCNIMLISGEHIDK